MSLQKKMSVFFCFMLLSMVNGRLEANGGDNNSPQHEEEMDEEISAQIYPDPNSPLGTKSITCFSIDSTVQTPSGYKTLRDVKPGEKVLTVSDSGSLKYEPVIVDAHHLPHLHTNFYKIQTEANEIMVTSKHYLYVGVSVDESELITSDSVVVGDSLLVYNNSALAAEKVVNMELVSAPGISNPIVSSGRILVNHVLASAYSEAPPFTPTLSHGLVWPFRMFYKYNINIYGGETYGMPHVAFYLNMIREKLAY